MIIKNISGGRLIIGFINHGIILANNQTYTVDEKLVENKYFRDLENAGKLQIMSYGADHTRYAVREEVISGGSGTAEVTRTSSIDFPAEAVLRGASFVYQLDPLPRDPDGVLMFVGGMKQEYNADFTVLADGTINWLAGADFDIELTDEVQFRYTIV